MFAHIFHSAGFGPVTAVGIAFMFIGCFIALNAGLSFLPADGGRDVTGGKRSKGKPTGAGIILILFFDVAVLLFSSVSPELFIYIVLVSAEMITGFLDDGSKTEWGRLKKGLFDLGISILFAVTYLGFNPNTFQFAVSEYTVQLPIVVYGILIVILAWASINVTNCADGVDGLTGCLCCVTFVSIMALLRHYEIDPGFRSAVLFMIIGLLAYLWYNASPSRLMMGDAGSRSIGLFLAIAIVKTHHPLLYLLLAIVLIVDGGLGLIKITFIKATHNSNFMSFLRTPVHDHFRKNYKWSDTQVVVRFTAFQAIFCLGVVCYVY